MKEAQDLSLEGLRFATLKLEERVDDLAQQIAALAPGTMQLGLEAYNTRVDMPFDAALPYLRTQTDACLNSPDAKEGIAAFLEKRDPKWD